MTPASSFAWDAVPGLRASTRANFPGWGLRNADSRAVRHQQAVAFESRGRDTPSSAGIGSTSLPDASCKAVFLSPFNAPASLRSDVLGFRPRTWARPSLANAGASSFPNDFGSGDGNAGDGRKGTGGNGGGGDQGGGSGGDESDRQRDGNNSDWILGALAKGWNDRVTADPQFVFKVLTEQLIGVTACVIGDMASRPNFGLNELDFVFSTLVVGSLVNFLLMYMLAPVSAASSAATLPGIFFKCPTGHMFEAGSFTAAERFGTFVYKGLQFASAGFAAGLLGTAISNALLFLRKKIQPDFELQNPSPPTILNASTWALHLGVSSNLRYQCLNGIDGILSQKLSPSAFRSFVFIIRGLNNVIGGFSFAVLAKATGAQKAAVQE